MHAHSTPPTLFFAENIAGRVVDQGEGFLRLIWGSRMVASTERQALLEQVLAWFLTPQNTGLVLVDQRQMTPFTPEEQHWMNHDWLPRVIRAGYRARAILQAENVFSRLATSLMVGLKGDVVAHQFFTDETEASEWLLAQ